MLERVDLKLNDAIDFHDQFKPTIFIFFQPKLGGLVYRQARFVVYQIDAAGICTALKEFPVIPKGSSRRRLERALEKTQRWAAEQYGIREWKRNVKLKSWGAKNAER